MRIIYTALFYLALPFVFLRLLWRSRRLADYRYRWSERLGFAPYRLEKCIWIHAASVGETISAIPLIRSLQAEFPHLSILISNMTITGGIRTKATFGDTVYQTYIPYDLPDAAERFLDRLNPVIGIIMETELWPNIFHACQQRNIPILVANARLSEKSAKGYQRVASLTQQMLKAIHMMGIQTQVEADRFHRLGLPKERLVVTGSIKFDVQVPDDLESKCQALRQKLGKDRLIWIAASTHATEEEIILAAHKKILERFPQALLILVPRHPERFESVFTLTGSQFKTVRRSTGENATANTQVFLGDTMGELLLMYAASDVAFVAGSFAPIGGHNMLEAAVLGKPIVTGPQLFNFAEISQKLLASEGMHKVENANELANQIITLFQDENYRLKTGNNAKQFVDSNRGAVAKHVELVKAIL